MADLAGKAVLGGAIGFGIYMLVSGLGFGDGGRAAGRGAGSSPTAEVPPSLEPPVSPPVAPQPVVRDQQPLNFLLSPRGFEARDAAWMACVPAKIYALADVVARVKAGGRADLDLKISGATLQKDVEAALTGLSRAGIKVFRSTSTQVSGTRGAYRRGVPW